MCFSVEGTFEGFQSVGLEVQVLHHNFCVRILQLVLLVPPHHKVCVVTVRWRKGVFFSGYWAAGCSPSGKS